jgi:hypothetical protein
MNAGRSSQSALREHEADDAPCLRRALTHRLVDLDVKAFGFTPTTDRVDIPAELFTDEVEHALNVLRRLVVRGSFSVVPDVDAELHAA